MRTYMEQWYAGGGLFNDGEEFAMNYFKSNVIQPYLATIMDAVSGKDRSYDWCRGELKEITQKYAEIQERSIRTDGTGP